MNIHPLISHQFNSAIWRMEIDELSDTLFVELRNTAEKQTSFAAVSLTTSEIFFDDLTTPERWLCGIEAAYDGVLLLHYYQSETGPTHKGLLAVNGRSGETLWSNFTYAVDYLSVNGPIVYDTRIQPRKLFLADIKTGATNRINGPSVYQELTNQILAPQFITPDILQEKGIPLDAHGNITHYLEYNNLRFVSLHALKNGLLTQSLHIFEDNRQVYEDILNEEIQKMQPEAFIMHKGRLIYIKNKSALKILTL
jgi:hypothetical protein